jgi:GTP-binding protein
MSRMSILRNTQFLTTVADLAQLPRGTLAEVAFVGRSNAGKSSAINTLCDHTRLAYVSKTPGRTQHLNFFTVQDGEYLVDLPGYGFAKVPEEVSRSWNRLIAPYLAERRQLAGLVVIMDARHPMTELDGQLLDWFLPTGTPVHVLLSKADKLTRQEQAKTLREVTAMLARFGGQVTVQLFSSLKKAGVDEARKVILGWLGSHGRPDPDAGVDLASEAPVA